MTSLKWGSSVNSNKGTEGNWVDPDVIKEFESITGGEIDEDGNVVANENLSKYVKGLIDESKPYETFTPSKDKETATFSDVPTGYYLIIDNDKEGSGNTTVLSSNIIKVVGTVNITLKTTDTTSEKKIIDENKKPVDINDYNINETITYQLKAKLGSGLSAYETYELIFTDTLSSGLDFINIESVKIDGEDALQGTYTVATGKYNIPSDNKDYNSVYEGGSTLVITFDDLFKSTNKDKKELSGKEVIITYKAKLNNKAIVGHSGNPNELKLTYSRDPKDSKETTTTTPDEVVVFTFELKGTKVDGEKKTPLKDAVFALRKKEGDDWKYAQFEIVDGKYKVQEEWITNNIPVSADNITQDDIDKLLSGNTALPEKAKVTTDANGNFNFSGLDTGDYQLIELVAPNGYNLLTKPVKVSISAKVNKSDMPIEEDNNSKVYNITELTGTVDSESVTGNTTNGTLPVNVVNNKGTTLPETGGMGTTMIYLVGGGLVLLSAVLLVTRKRVNG